MRPEPTAALVLVMSMWPDGEWVSEAEVAEHLHREGQPIEVTADGFALDDRPLRTILNEARRRSWLSRLRDPDKPTTYRRTHSGCQAVAATQEGPSRDQ